MLSIDQSTNAPAITARRVHASKPATDAGSCAVVPNAALAALELVALALAAETLLLDALLLMAPASTLRETDAAVAVSEPRTELRSELLAPPWSTIDEATERYE